MRKHVFPAGYILQMYEFCLPVDNGVAMENTVWRTWNASFTGDSVLARRIVLSSACACIAVHRVFVVIDICSKLHRKSI